MRSRFDEQLEKLNAELITMGALCEQAITIAINALVYGNDDDKAQFNKVHETEREIDQKERDIENLCMKLLLQQQPVASDLRKISSALKMISDITMHIRFENLKSKVHISDMAAAAIKMVTDSINSFVKKDLELVKAVAAYDDVVDRLFIKVKDELLELIKDGDVSCLDLLMIAKYLERIGDHAVNIAEWVEYSITGQKLL